ncbi:MAG: hypothetical protein HC884_07865 [Chloroflexaceae bacterium]|nr:hypothetical protein [Chloroflexaceae bacterium]
MPQRAWFWPLSVVVMGLVVVGLILAEPTGHPQAAQAIPYPDATNTRTPTTYPSPTQSQTTTSSPTPSPTETPSPTTEGDTTDSDSETNTPEPTETPAEDTPTTGPTPTPTRTASPTRTPTTSSANVPTPEPTEEDGQAVNLSTTGVTSSTEVLVCHPGLPVEVRGREAPPAESLLLLFGGRVVGGGISDVQGNYVLYLTVGAERSGDYPVEIRVRGKRTLVDRRYCHVPAPTPTPTIPPAPTP